MKREDILDSLEYIDDEFLEEADRTRRTETAAAESEKITPIRRKPAAVRRWVTLAASFAVLIIAAVALSGIMKFRSGNMSAMKSSDTAPIEEQRIEQYAPEETAAAKTEDNAAEEYAAEETAAAEPGDNAAEEYAAEEMAAAEPGDNAAEEYAAEETAAAEAEKFETEEMIGAAAEPYAADAMEDAAAKEYAGREKTDMYAAEEPGESIALAAGSAKAAEGEEMAAAAKESVTIRITADAGEVVFVLNDTPAAQSLAAQLPLRAAAAQYGDNGIVFHPGEPLDTENGVEDGGSAGSLAYYAPLNRVVLYYGDFEADPGLYLLGEAVSGAEIIEDIRGRITIE